jgi:hypothetical protein
LREQFVALSNNGESEASSDEEKKKAFASALTDLVDAQRLMKATTIDFWQTLASSLIALRKICRVRLYFSSFAYILVHALRRLGLEGTELAKAQCDTIRLRLFKIGAQIRVSVRKVWISFSESYPYFNLFQQVLLRLQQIPLRC